MAPKKKVATKTAAAEETPAEVVAEQPVAKKGRAEKAAPKPAAKKSAAALKKEAAAAAAEAAAGATPAAETNADAPAAEEKKGKGAAAKKPAAKKAAAPAAKKKTNCRDIGVNTASKVSRGTGGGPRYGWVLPDHILNSPEHLAKTAIWEKERREKYEKILPTYTARMRETVWAFINSVYWHALTMEQQSGIVRQALYLPTIRKADTMCLRDLKRIMARSENTIAENISGADKMTTTTTTKDAATQIDFFELFGQQMEKALKLAIAKRPTLVSYIPLTKADVTNPYDTALYTDAQRELMSGYEGDHVVSLLTKLQDDIEPKERMSFTFAEKWKIIQAAESGKKNDVLADEFGCKPEEIAPWRKNREQIRALAMDPATADSKRLR